MEALQNALLLWQHTMTLLHAAITTVQPKYTEQHPMIILTSRF